MSIILFYENTVLEKSKRVILITDYSKEGAIQFEGTLPKQMLLQKGMDWMFRKMNKVMTSTQIAQ